MERENQLLEQKELREKNLGRIEVLEQVGNLLLLSNTEYATMEMVSEYYNVGLEAINSLVKDNREEIASNGFKVLTKEELKSLKNLSGIKSRAKQLAIFPKRAILNVGMLLRDSEVAQDIRSRLLDITHDAETETASIKTIVEEVDKELQLQQQLGVAICSGNMQKVIEIQTEINAIKNSRISRLEKEKEIIINHSTTIEESRSVINRLIKIMASKTGLFGKVWNEFYSKINYKLGINIKARKKKPLDSMSEEEMFEAEIIARNWAMKSGIDVDAVLSLN